jgi:hypothetical protein
VDSDDAAVLAIARVMHIHVHLVLAELNMDIQRHHEAVRQVVADRLGFTSLGDRYFTLPRRP